MHRALAAANFVSDTVKVWWWQQLALWLDLGTNCCHNSCWPGDDIDGDMTSKREALSWIYLKFLLITVELIILSH
jgi:hypothetical protein